MNFLLHEMAVFAFFSGNRIPGNGVDFGLNFHAFQRFDSHTVLRHDGHLPGFQEDDLASVLQNSGDIRSDKVFTLSQTDHHAASITDAGGYDLVGFIRRDEQHNVCAIDPLEGAAGGFNKVDARSLMMLRQMNNGFSIRVRQKGHPFCAKLILDLEEIFHDAIMHNHHAARLPKVGMRIARRRSAVSRPARMADARRASERGFGDQFH